ncbi:Arylsulfatase precursor [Rubinisphaera italica]|uniref:Arylsulfatase n=2 Tax=Rubinisphaera italica TaxID=2527969 RepID=A0A5C5XJW1_9PLAN|nr:Arylsulfatase precursor [Rubinisphaera italica]
MLNTSKQIDSYIFNQFMRFRFSSIMMIFTVLFLSHSAFQNSVAAEKSEQPNIVLVMADDMGWGQTGYYNHPVLKTPNLDAMATNGLRFDRFYAGAPVCSPTRASVLTGRSNMRTGVESHGYALRLQEKTVAQALKAAGYTTGHFGKWHLDGYRGPGVPILADDPYSPGVFGFDEWLSVTNFFDYDPILSRKGEFKDYRGDSSEIVVAEALKFINKQAKAEQPSFTVIWYGTPHSPFKAAAEDLAPFQKLDKESRNHYGELVAMDRSLGTLRAGLKKAGIAENTLLWFCSDNGGLPKITPDTVGGLRGNKGTVYEGGLRVPCVMEWPARIPKSRVTEFPACTMDIFPTIAELLDLPKSVLIQPVDGMSLVKLFEQEFSQRDKPIGFQCLGNSALLDNNHKIIYLGKNKKQPQPAIEYYNLADDPHEEHNLYSEDSKEAQAMKQKMDRWIASVEKSIAGKDYPAGKVDPPTPKPRSWYEAEEYRPYFKDWKDRWEYQSRFKN